MSPLSSILSRGKDASDDVEVDGAAAPAEVADHAPPAPIVVRVNLLPPEIAEAAAFRRGQIVRAGVVAASLVLAAGGVVMASNSVSSAQDELAAEEETQARLKSRVAELSIVPQTQLRLDTAREQLRGAMAAEVNWATYLNAIGIDTPAGVAYTDVTISQAVDAPEPGKAGTSSPNTSMLGTPGIATVTVNGVARSHEKVADFLRKLDNARIGNVDPYFTSATVEVDDASKKDVVRFSAVVTVTDAAKTNRFVKEGD